MNDATVCFDLHIVALFFMRKEFFMTEKQCYTVGIYCRLSLDDERQGESSSITTQKQILENYVKSKKWIIGKIYTDDGYSGVNFERPAFKEMIRDIEDGKIDCVITKDLSRLGRNYVQTGIYTEAFFPEHDVRYIAINDNYDTLTGGNDLAPFRNIINEWFSRDQSKKLKQAFKNKAENGKTLASHPPYGYIYPDGDKTRYVIDPEYAPIVKLIFELCIGGMGITMIARELYKRQIPTPSYVIYQRFGAFAKIHENKPEDKKYSWEVGQIRKMLSWDVYLGHLVQGTKTSKSYKDKRMIEKPKDEWIVFENAHEPIIDQETFDLAQEKIKSRKRAGKRGEVTIFAGLLKCFDCGKTMRIVNRVSERKKSEPRYYSDMNCHNYLVYGNTRCSSHYMNYEYFLKSLTDSVRDCIKAVELDEKGLVQKILKQNNFETASQHKLREKELTKAQKRLKDIDNLFAKLYEDRLEDKINERNYEMLSKKYQAEQEELMAKEKLLLEQLAENKSNECDIQRWIDLIKKYKDFQEFDRVMLNELIKVIYIHKPEIVDGKKEIQIDIHYNFVGKIN